MGEAVHNCLVARYSNIVLRLALYLRALTKFDGFEELIMSYNLTVHVLSQFLNIYKAINDNLRAKIESEASISVDGMVGRDRFPSSPEQMTSSACFS